MSAVSNEKVAAYLKIVNLFVEFFADKDAAARNTKKNPQYFKKAFVEIGAHLFVFGSDEVTKQYLEFRRHAIASAKQESNMETIKYVADLLLAMRKELVGAETQISAHDFMKMITNDWASVDTI